MMQVGRRNVTVWTVLTVGTLAFFCVFLLYPLFNLFSKSLYDPQSGSITFEYFERFFSKKYYYSAFLNSLKITCSVTALTCLLGTPLAYIMKTVQIKGKGLLEVIVIMSILSPPFVGAYSWILLLGRNGIITRVINMVFGVTSNGIYGFPGILLVFTLQMYPLVYLYASGAINKMDHSLNEAAESLGSTGMQKIMQVVIPVIMPTIAAAGLLVFMRSFADFGTPMLIGEGYRVMPVLIYNEFIGEMGGSDAFAASLSLLVVLFTTVLFIAQKYITGKKQFSMNATRPVQPKKQKGYKNILAHLFVYLVIGITFLPQIVVIYTSFLKTSGTLFTKGFSLYSYSEAFRKMGTSIGNTFIFSIAAIIVILVLGLIIAYLSVRRKNALTGILDIVSMLPYVISGSVMGIAILLAFNKQPLYLSGTTFIIILVFILRRLPYTIRSSAAILGQIQPSIEEAAISLGASNTKAFTHVTVPIMMPGVMSGAILSWMTIISELSASILLYIGSTRTLTIAIYTEVSRGNYGVAAALSTILLLSTLAALLLFFKISGRREIDM